MDLSSRFIQKLKNGARPNILITIWNDRTLTKTTHPALLPGSIRACIQPIEVAHRTLIIPFTPSLSVFPEITVSIDPLGKVINPSTLSLSINRLSSFNPEIFLYGGGSLSSIVRADLHIDGMALSDLVPVFIGNISQSTYNKINNSVTISATDSQLIDNTTYPPGDITLDTSLFSKIPIAVSGRFKRRVILGEVTYPLICPQVDDGNTFYIADHPVSVRNDDTFYIGGPSGPITDRFTVKRFPFPDGKISATGRKTDMSVIEFDKKQVLELPYVLINNITGLSGSKNPILTLLDDYSGYNVSDDARSKLSGTNFHLSVLTQGQDDTISYVTKRLLPQTQYMGGFRSGEFVIMDIEGEESGIHLSDTSGIYDYADSIVQETDESKVVNALDIGWQRNIFSETDFDTTRHRFLLDKNTAVGKLAQYLELSEKFYGRRVQPMQFADISISSNLTPDIIKTVAYKMLYNNYKQKKIYSFNVPFYPGLFIKENSIVTITFPKFSLSNAKMRLIQKTHRSYCMTLSFMLEN